MWMTVHTSVVCCGSKTVHFYIECWMGIRMVTLQPTLAAPIPRAAAKTTASIALPHRRSPPSAPPQQLMCRVRRAQRATPPTQPRCHNPRETPFPRSQVLLALLSRRGGGPHRRDGRRRHRRRPGGRPPPWPNGGGEPAQDGLLVLGRRRAGHQPVCIGHWHHLAVGAGVEVGNPLARVVLERLCGGRGSWGEGAGREGRYDSAAAGVGAWDGIRGRERAESQSKKDHRAGSQLLKRWGSAHPQRPPYADARVRSRIRSPDGVRLMPSTPPLQLCMEDKHATGSGSPQ